MIDTVLIPNLFGAEKAEPDLDRFSCDCRSCCPFGDLIKEEKLC